MAVSSTNEVLKRLVNQMAETAYVGTGVESQFIPTTIPDGEPDHKTINVDHVYKFHSQRIYNTVGSEPTLTKVTPVDKMVTIGRKTFPGDYVGLYPYDLDLYAYDKKAAHIGEMVKYGARSALRYQRYQLAPATTTEGLTRIFYTDNTNTKNIRSHDLFRVKDSNTNVKVQILDRDPIMDVMNKIWDDFGEQEGLPVIAIVPPEMWNDLVKIYKATTHINVNQQLLRDGVLQTYDGVTFYRSQFPAVYSTTTNHGVDTNAKRDVSRLHDPVAANLNALYNSQNTIGALFLVLGQGIHARSTLHGPVYENAVDAKTQQTNFSYAPSISVGKIRTKGEGSYALMYRTSA